MDHIAKALIDWCDSISPKLKEYVIHNNGLGEEVKREFFEFFKLHSSHLVLSEQPVYESKDNVDLVFNPMAENPKEKVIAEFNIESKDGTNFERSVLDDINKLSMIANIKDDYKNAIKCVISLYYNISNRNQLHDKDFIELYNDLEIGCALKRLK
ncbi:MAG: hypothetical protein JEZ09_04650 [Salinivirgaceae bacterium]|nr:hypothetical protein [Salinivirgaceae bacterium]